MTRRAPSVLHRAPSAARRACLLGALPGILGPVLALNFSDSGAWRAPLSLDATSLNRGDPSRVAWGVVPDGTRIAYPGTTSNLRGQFLARFGPNYRQMFALVFSRLGAVSGLELIESADDGATAGESTPPLGTTPSRFARLEVEIAP